MTENDRSFAPSSARAAAWQRALLKARWLLLVAAGIAVGTLVVTLVTDTAHDEAEARDRMRLATEARAHSLAVHLGALARELNRLGLHSEIDLLDENLEPERTLLRLSHGQSTFFNVGVALLDAEGTVAWSEPQTFLPPASRFAGASWFREVLRHRQPHLAPVAPERDDALLYVVSPVVRKGTFAGALIGGIDLAGGREFFAGPASQRMELLLVDREGAAIFPGRPPEFTRDERWRSLFDNRAQAWIAEAPIDGVRTVVAATAVPTTNLFLASIAPADVLYGPARGRLRVRLAAGLALALVPLAVVVFLHQRTLHRFRRQEDDAVRTERLAHLGSAANVIAHEVKNSLNGIRLGLDLLQQKGTIAPRVMEGMRAEIARLTDFTTELLLFARGIHPRPVEIDLAELVRRVGALSRSVADDRGIELRVEAEVELPIRADPRLIHVVLSNLIANALDAASGSGAERPVVEVRAEATPGGARVEVRDEGTGVPEAIRSTLFEPFVTGKPSGSGIGLFIARRIAEAHGGDLQLASSSERGATFVLHLRREIP